MLSIIVSQEGKDSCIKFSSSKISTTKKRQANGSFVLYQRRRPTVATSLLKSSCQLVIDILGL
jgi:hypothetical protein